MSTIQWSPVGIRGMQLAGRSETLPDAQSLAFLERRKASVDLSCR